MRLAEEEKSVGVYELKAHLPSVLEEVLGGAVVTVTRHGHPVARIVPVAATSSEERRAAIARMKAARTGRSLGQSVKSAIEEGRP